jgi:taurine dioxygenase
MPRASTEDNSCYELIRPAPLMPGFAARIDGLDLRRPICADAKAELHRALLEFEVLLFAAQELSPERHIDLASAFGTVATGAFFPRKDGYPQVEIITFDEQNPPELNVWHSDVTWKSVPPTGTVIQVTELPVTGGNTVWSSGSKAFEALSHGFKTYLRGLTATHSWQGSLVQDALETAGEDAVVNAVRRFKAVVHPLIRRHPESGKDVLFVNEAFTRRINDVSFRESRAILEFLREWMIQPEFVYSHRWERNGIAVWDNRTTQHYAVADYWPQRRTVQRVTFQSDCDMKEAEDGGGDAVFTQVA